MSDPLTAISTLRTPQSQQADPRQEKNAAGGYTFVVDEMTRLRRFLTLGTTGGTYYVSEKDQTVENGKVILDLARNRASDVVAAVVEVSTQGRAPKQNPALFTLAAAAKLGDKEGSTAAYQALPQVARTASHLFQFLTYLAQFGGWGNGTMRAVSRWYLERDGDDLAYQLVKYRQRGGLTHGDVIRQAHPFRWKRPGNQVATAEDLMTDHGAHRALFDWALASDSRGDQSEDRNHNATDHRARHAARTTGAYREYLPAIVDVFEHVQRAARASEVVELIERSGGSLSWEMIPDRFLNEPTVWTALIDAGIPQTALIRQLPRLTNLGLLKPMSMTAAKVATQLVDPARLLRGRVHPMSVLIALRTYASGQSARGETTWTPSRPIVDALDAAFYASYGAVEPTGKRMLLALDASSSMTRPVAGAPMTCREAAAAMALVTANTEPSYELVAFTADDYLRSHLEYDGHGGAYHRRGHLTRHDMNEHAVLTPLAISPRQRLDDVVKTVQELAWAGTNCALPMIYALREGLEVDLFAIYTDSETWHGDIHPHQALEQYRRETGIPARLVVVAMTTNGSTIADPSDPGTLDVSGFDSTVPSLIGDFARGL